MEINTRLTCVWRVCVSLKFIPMEMIYHRLAYLLILHHWDHMHNTNHKDFSKVVTGFRIKVGNIWEHSSKAIETSGAKMNQLKHEYIRHVKTNHSIHQLPPLYISCINKPLSWNFRRNYEHGQFVTLKTISSITSFFFFFFFFTKITSTMELTNWELKHVPFHQS